MVHSKKKRKEKEKGASVLSVRSRYQDTHPPCGMEPGDRGPVLYRKQGTGCALPAPGSLISSLQRELGFCLLLGAI